MNNSSTLTIGRLAKAAGVNIETIRHYQNKGIIIEPAKPSRGFRQYPKETIELIYFVKRSQNLGFTLKEIKLILELGESRCADVERLASEKLQALRSRLGELQTMVSTIDTMLNACHNQDKSSPCNFVKAVKESCVS